MIQPDSVLSTSCGTLSYMPPEVLKGRKYAGPPVDMWAIGVIAYILLCGYPPFYGNNDSEIFNRTVKADYKFISPDWDEISRAAKEFIKLLLIVDPERRMTAQQALKHEWMVAGEARGTGSQLLAAQQNLRKNFNARAKLKGAIDAVKFLNKFQMTSEKEPGVGETDGDEMANHSTDVVEQSKQQL